MAKEKWYRLDNAAKIFPAVSNKNRSNVFSISFLLNEDIDPLFLQEALNIALERFPAYNVSLRSGLFWHYFDKNYQNITVTEEDPRICSPFSKKEGNGFLFKVSYYKRKIVMNVFHALTDGTGATEFLKAIVFTYLNLQGKAIADENLVITNEIEERKTETEDSFVQNYRSDVTINRKEETGIKIQGTAYEENWNLLIVGQVSVDEFKSVCKKYDCTITEMMCALVFHSAIASKEIFEKKKLPFRICVPVNLRRFFPSNTLRNFSLYIRTGLYLDNEISFEEIVKHVKEEFKDGLQKDKLQAGIVANVKFEKNFLMRITPLIFKQIAMKIGYNLIGESPNSFSLSNLGIVMLPEAMKPYVENVIFSTGASNNVPIYMAAVSYNGKLNISFTSTISEKNIQKAFFRKLSALGIRVVIETNETGG